MPNEDYDIRTIMQELWRDGKMHGSITRDDLEAIIRMLEGDYEVVQWNEKTS